MAMRLQSGRLCMVPAGDSQLGPKVTPLDPSSVASVVQFGTKSGHLTRTETGTSLVYSQIYPFKGLLNYTSGIIHHVRLTGDLTTLFLESLQS